MSDETEQQHEERALISAVVTFSLGKKEPYHHGYARSTTVGAVLDDARKHFDAKDEPNVVWYLSAHDERQPNDKTLEQLVGHEDEIKFRLVKEVTQG
ncbi:MAG TPA: hypothetical protein VGQ42_12085 [Candidatus Dormibacteraeota bacterium]|jgi:hypothetical protein|nr:hypothetical protein [Candidatus Dormibacteraeota bacterium]